MKVRGKRIYFVLVVLIVAIMARYTVYQQYISSKPRFRFLSGLERTITINFSRDGSVSTKGTSEVYSFLSDFNDVYPVIRIELQSLGFREGDRYKQSNQEHYFERTGRGRCIVRVLRDTRLLEQSTPEQLLYVREDGWTIVHVNQYRYRVSWWHYLSRKFRVLRLGQ